MIKKDILGRKIPIRTQEWKDNIAKGNTRGRFDVCKCGKKFWVYPHREKKAKYCSKKCWGKYGSFGFTKGMKIPKGSLSKMGDKNPMRIHGIKPEHLQALHKGAKKYQDSIRVSKEHKRIVKRLCELVRNNTKRGNGGSFTKNEWEEIKKKQEYKCLHCKKQEPEIKLTVDHIIPISKGGTSFKENLQGLCRKCNAKKGTKYENIQ